jgi:hypothetical protein
LVTAGAPPPDDVTTNGAAVTKQAGPAVQLAPQPHFPHAGRPMPIIHRGPVDQRPPSMTLLYVWILLFGFVGTQLAWTLRPFFGSPGQPFGLYREIDGNFYAEIIRTLSHLF